jgi:hypothetical protein
MAAIGAHWPGVVQHGVPLGVDVVCMTPPLLMGSIFPIGDLVSIPGGEIFYMRAKKNRPKAASFGGFFNKPSVFHI